MELCFCSTRMLTLHYTSATRIEVYNSLPLQRDQWYSEPWSVKLFLIPFTGEYYHVAADEPARPIPNPGLFQLKKYDVWFSLSQASNQELDQLSVLDCCRLKVQRSWGRELPGNGFLRQDLVTSIGKAVSKSKFGQPRGKQKAEKPGGRKPRARGAIYFPGRPVGPGAKGKWRLPGMWGPQRPQGLAPKGKPQNLGI